MDGGNATSNIVDNKKPTSQSQTNDDGIPRGDARLTVMIQNLGALDDDADDDAKQKVVMVGVEGDAVTLVHLLWCVCVLCLDVW